MQVFLPLTLHLRRLLKTSYKEVHGMYNILEVHSILQNCSMYGVCIANCLNYSIYNSIRTQDGIVNTFITNSYSMRQMSKMIMIPGHV